jgi:hypothetical protein
MRSEKHDIAIVVFDDAGIVNGSDRIGHILACQDGVIFKAGDDWIVGFS